ncbi:MAG TPA: DinB family protein [Vicinamibacterales bacterium]|nr:DinB family protein [Vicinamibacterales bacterium]
MRKSADPLRAHLVRLLDWEEAHVGFDKAIDGIPPKQRGSRIGGFPHSPWQLLEHMRLGQKDLLDFCLNANYEQVLKWPDDYWPQNAAPPGAAAWKESVTNFKADREKLKRLVQNPNVDLLSSVPTGHAKQTYLRAILLLADHNAYHVGQLVALRQALGIWR